MIRVLAMLAALSGTAEAAPCRQALALGLDVSGSVDTREYRLQLEGLAGALDNILVRDALLQSAATPVWILIYEWSGPSDQAIIVNWTPIRSAIDLEGVINTLRQTTRRDASPGTALGVAMTLGAAYLAQRPDCGKLTLDISGDGTSNSGPRPRDVKELAQDRNITVNALAIGGDVQRSGDQREAEISALSSYFRAEVIAGPDAFVETALGFDDYETAMTRKLLRELAVVAVAQASPNLR